MQENILAVDLSTEQVLEVNLPEQDNIAQIDVYWQDEVTLDLDLSLMYIVSGQREIQDYVDNKSKPEIDDYIETYAKSIVSDVVEEIAAPVVGDYIENTVKPEIKEFANTEMANYAQVAGEQATIATNQANLAEASALASSETLTLVNNKAEEFGVAVNTAKVDIQSATDTSITNINNTVSAEIIPNLEGYVSSATNQAIIATSKANEAQASASAAKTSETNAKTSEANAKSYAETLQNLLPNQENNAGKYLTTDGTNPSWQEVNLTNKANVDLSNVSSNIDYVVASYQNGSNWYKVYKSGWIDQGGKIAGTSAKVTYLKPFKDTNYTISYSRQTTKDAGLYDGNLNIRSHTATGCELKNEYGTYMFWRACGQGAK